LNYTYACPAFGFDGPYENCAWPCSKNPLLLGLFYVSTPMDAANWTAELTICFIYSLVPTFMVLFPAFYFLAGSKKDLPILPVIGALLVAFCSIENNIVAKLIGKTNTRLKYRPGHDPQYQELFTAKYGNFGKSCNHSFGMPSGHSTNAIGGFTWVVLELWWGWGRDKGFSTNTKVLYSIIAALITWPVLPARVGVYDHLWAQVTVGGFQGILIGTCAFFLLRKYLGPRFARFCNWVNRTPWCPCGTKLCCGRPLTDSYWTGAGNSLNMGLGQDMDMELGPDVGRMKAPDPLTAIQSPRPDVAST
jgi:membrane-associated phospholipid phosphatase